MTIQTGDVLLLKSQINLDTPDGGGSITSMPVVDGLSNNVFPDISALDRTFGRTQLRKVFAAVQTSNTDSYFGANVIITKPPEDTNVGVALFTTKNWTDRRNNSKDKVQRYLATGPRLACQIIEKHYAGSLLLNLFSTETTDFPKGGDVVVLRNPDATEQYVRIFKADISLRVFTIDNGTPQGYRLSGFVCSCELGQALLVDFDGGNIKASNNNSNAINTLVYSSTIAAGAKFYGIKPILQDATIGSLTVDLEDIFTAIVPSTTAETALIDQRPFTLLTSLSNKNNDLVDLILPAAVVNLGPNTKITLPTPAQPNKLSLIHNGTVFADDGSGKIKQGQTIVGSVDYWTGIITMLANSPSYGNAYMTCHYKPSCAISTSPYSDSLTMTQSNQGFVYTYIIEPPPAPATLVISYMAQGNWYELQDNGNGKLSGADSTYGTGTVSYATGTVALTLGALPDIGSDIIYQWGDGESVQPIPLTQLPKRLSTVLDLDKDTINATLTWSRDGLNYTALYDISGNITGDATGSVLSQADVKKVSFLPSVLPAGAVSIAATRSVLRNKADAVIGNFTLLANVIPLSFNMMVAVEYRSGFIITGGGFPLNIGNPYKSLDTPYIGGDPIYSTRTLLITDDGQGSLRYLKDDLIYGNVGNIDYATGSVTLLSNVALSAKEIVATRSENLSNGYKSSYTAVHRDGVIFNLSPEQFIVNYNTADGSTNSITSSITPLQWTATIKTPWQGVLQDSSIAFVIGEIPYTSKAGVLRSGWDMLAGAADNNSAGAISSSGVISLTSTALPINGINVLQWSNACATGNVKPVSSGVFRTANSPLKQGVMQLRSGILIASASAQGVLSGGGFSGTVDFVRGIVRWKREGLPEATSLNAYTYDETRVLNTTGTATAVNRAFLTNINKFSVIPETVSYNAVYLQYIPIDSDILGIDTTRLPLDGRVPIYRKGDMLVIHHTDKTEFLGTPYVGQVLNVGRVRLSMLRVIDSTGITLNVNMYNHDLDAGTITLKSNYVLGTLVLPLYAEHRVEDSAVMTEVQISGRIKINQPLSHNYPANSSYASSALLIGDMQARIFGLFSQQSWTNTWSNELIGDAPVSQYNDTVYPILTTNKGATEEQWALIFTTNTAYRVVGHSIGQIAIGNINDVLSPLNPATNQPYFTLDPLGFGAGWSAGNVIRFNTAAANYPIWISRTILQGQSSTNNDSFEMAIRGDIDR